MRSSDRGAALAMLTAAIQALDETPLDRLSDLGLAAEMRALWSAACRLHAQLNRRIAAFDERGAAGRDGARSSRAWLRHRLRIDGVDAARQVTVATGLGRLPHTAIAYRRGDISTDHAAAICEAAWQLGDDVMAAGAERMLLDVARREAPGRVRRLARRLRERVDPPGSLAAVRRSRDERFLDAARGASGAIVLRGQLDAADGEVVVTALGATAEATADTRTAAQRRADALVAACRAALRADLFFPGERPRVVVTVPLSALRRDLGEAVLGSGEPVPADTARRLACDARVIPAVLGAASEPLDIGRESAVVPQGLRRALELRDRTCRFPGCDQPAGGCVAHHVVHWANGGPTTVDNLVLLCDYHHVLTHEGGWRVAREPFSGEVHAWRPDGIRLDAVSPPPEPPALA
jgi:Domain of unknown function (DUF222)/HNH endonuclease